MLHCILTEVDSMAKPFAFILVNDGDVEVRIIGFGIIHYFIPKVSNNQDEFSYPNIRQLLNNITQYSFPGHRNQRFGLGIGMWPEFCTRTGNWYDCFHDFCFCLTLAGNQQVKIGVFQVKTLT